MRPVMLLPCCPQPRSTDIPTPIPAPSDSTNGNNTSGCDGGSGVGCTTDLLPIVLAVLQLRLDLSGPAASAWMGTLDGSGGSSDVQVLGHDAGALIALPIPAQGTSTSGRRAGVSGGSGGCNAETLAAMAASVTAISGALGAYGAAVRTWACLPGPNFNISAAKVSLYDKSRVSCTHPPLLLIFTGICKPLSCSQ